MRVEWVALKIPNLEQYVNFSHCELIPLGHCKLYKFKDNNDPTAKNKSVPKIVNKMEQLKTT